MKTTKNRQASGFTVMEMMIYGGLLSIFILIMSQTFASILETQLGSESNAAIVQDGRYILSRMSYDIGRASGISTPAVLGDVGPVLVLNIAGTGHTYSVSNGLLQLTNSFGTQSLNSFGTQVSGVTFERLGNTGGHNSIRVRYTLTSTTTRTTSTDSRTFQSTFSLR
jgi:hypothetical protein